MSRHHRAECSKEAKKRSRREAAVILAPTNRDFGAGIRITCSDGGNKKSQNGPAVILTEMNDKFSQGKQKHVSWSKKAKKSYRKEKAAIYMTEENDEREHTLYERSDHCGPGSSSSASQVPSQLVFEESHVEKMTIEFDGDGQPVGDNSDSYASNLGRLTKTHCSIKYESFKSVPKEDKELIWRKVKDEYSVSEAFKKYQFKKIAKHFREYKHMLRTKIYDKYNNDEDRKEACPNGVKQEDWEMFVDNESKPTRMRLRDKGKRSRMAVKALHTSGRRGSARTMHILKKKNPTAMYTRTDSFMAIHTRKDGTFIAPEQMARVIAIVEADPSSKSLTLDEDPVAQVWGIEKDGHVRGYGVGVSKASLLASAPAKENLHQATQKCIIVEDRVSNLENQVHILTKYVKDMTTQMAMHFTSQQSHRSAVVDSATSKVKETSQQSQKDFSHCMLRCQLFNFQREIVAKGKATREIMFSSGDDPMELYKVRVNLVLEPDERLFGSKMKLGELDLPKSIKWPAQFTRFV